MTIAFSCPGCGKQFRVSDNMAGRKAKCSACATVMLVPASEQGIAASPTQQPQPQEELVQQEAPRRKKRPRKKSRTNLVLALVGIGGTLLGLCVCCPGLFFGLGKFGVWDPLGLFSSLPAESRFLPEHCQFVTVFNWEQFLDSQAYKDLRKEIPQLKEDELNKNLPVPASILVMQMEGASGALGSGGGEQISIFKLKNDIGRADVEKKISGGQPRLIKVKNYDIYASDKGKSFCFVNSRTILVSQSGETIRKILERDREPTLGANMKMALRKANFTKTASFAVDFDTLKAGSAGPGPMMPGGMANPLQKLQEIQQKAQAAGGYVHFGNSFDLDVSIVCMDSKAAEDIKKIVDGLITLVKNPETKDLIEGLQIKTSGAAVNFSASYKIETIVKLVRAGKAKFPFPGLGQARPPADLPAVARANAPLEREPLPRGQLDEGPQVAILDGSRRSGLPLAA
jgi:hypothetical protein